MKCTSFAQQKDRKGDFRKKMIHNGPDLKDERKGSTMKKKFNMFLVILGIICVFGYFSAEWIARGDVLNKVSFGVGGWLMLGGAALLVLCWGIVPIVSFLFGGYHQWIEPETITSESEKLAFLKRYAKFLLRQHKNNPPREIVDGIRELKMILDREKDIGPDECMRQLLHVVPQIRRTLIDKVGSRIIHDYMKKTAIVVMLSQRGKYDSIAMAVMQLSMTVELGKAYGYRPSWVFLGYYSGWIITNSILFGMIESSEMFEELFVSLLQQFASRLGKAIPIVGKAADITMQGITAMSIVYATGKIVQVRLLGNSRKLSWRRRIKYRLKGRKEAIVYILSLTGKQMVRTAIGDPLMDYMEQKISDREFHWFSFFSRQRETPDDNFTSDSE